MPPKRSQKNGESEALGFSDPPDSRIGRGVRSLVKYPIGLKLVFIIAGTIALALSTMILLASYFFRQDARIRIEEGNHQTAQVLSLKIEGDFLGIVGKVRLLLTLGSGSPAARAAFFEANPEILFAGVPGLASFVNAAALEAWGLEAEAFEGSLDEGGEAEALEDGRSAPIAVNLTPKYGRPALGIAVPYVEGSFRGSLLVILDSSGMLAALKPRGIGYSFVVNGRGQLILHPDAAALGQATDLSRLPIVDFMLRGATDNGQTIYRDQAGVEYLGSYRRAPFASLAAISVAPAELAFEAVERIRRRNLYLMGAVLSVSVLIVYFFSKTITRPVGILMDAAREIEEGRYALDLRPRTRDELGALTASFAEMGRGLDERERIKAAFGKFVNTEVAERALRNELSLGGERRRAVVCFADIRGFSMLSEHVSPEAVVELLNEFFSIMVGCIERSGGVVDKFIGDAIMAVWGAPVSTGHDEVAALEAALEIRQALGKYNELRRASKSEPLRIGMALNVGEVLAGLIGSSRRMEYTVIGDAVNLASRLESLTKPFAVDILVSEAMRAAAGEAYLVAPLPLAEIKGKEGFQRSYALLGRQQDPEAPRSLAELRARLGLERSAPDTKGIYSGLEPKYTISESGDS